jgi:hypothetical protein
MPKSAKKNSLVISPTREKKDGADIVRGKAPLMLKANEESITSIIQMGKKKK